MYKKDNETFLIHSVDCIDVKVDLVSEETPVVSEDYENIMDALVDIQENGDNMMAGIW